MFATNLVKYLSRRASASVGNVIKPLADAFLCVGTGRNVKQALIGLGVLHDSRCLPLHREHHRALALLKLFHEVAGSAAEGRQRLNVLGDVKQGPSPVISTLLGAYQNTLSA
jgi:hypothetical protein